MSEFLETKLDLILFFYGLAFILLGAVCLAIPKRDRHEPHWFVLALFAFTHGVNEWLDLVVLTIGDAPAFALTRTVIMTGSFLLLIEFARLGAIQLGRKTPGRWIYVPMLLSVALAGATGGLVVANVVARYAMGLAATVGTGLLFALLAGRVAGKEQWWTLSCALGFALYGVAAGVVVPDAPFWPAHFLNADSFLHFSGMPIQLVRALLVCWVAVSIWQIRWQRILLEASSPDYSVHFQKQRVWALLMTIAILGSGWGLTEYLGEAYKENMQNEMSGDQDLLARYFAKELVTVERTVKFMAGSPMVISALVSGSRQEYQRANSVLDPYVEASGAAAGYLMDSSGSVIASSNSAESAGLAGRDNVFRPYFQKAMAGQVGYFYGFDTATKQSSYYVSYPIRGEAGGIAGVAVLKKSLGAFEADLQQYDYPFCFINSHGVVVLTNRPTIRLGALWPLPDETKLALSQQFGKLNFAPMMKREFAYEAWLVLDGQRHFAQRRPVGHGDWSLVTFRPMGMFNASRLFGIIVTLLIAVLTLIYFVRIERAVDDNVRLAKLLELEEQARKLGAQATIDPLTGVYNRLKFNQALSTEMTRSTRYKTPLSLVLFDVDHFKKINDTYGHQIGDKVLVGLCQITAANIRETDLLARWGGDEFVILAPNTNDQMASSLAQKLRAAAAEFEFDKVGTLNCSFGIAQFRDGDTAETFMSRTDRALYQAKASGRKQVEII